MSLITPSLSSYSIPLYSELKDLDSMISDNSQVTQPKITTFSYNFMQVAKQNAICFLQCALLRTFLKGESP